MTWAARYGTLEIKLSLLVSEKKIVTLRNRDFSPEKRFGNKGLSPAIAIPGKEF